MLTPRAFLVPHLPTMLVDEHRHHYTEMLRALATVSETLRADAPAAAVVLSARWEAPGPFLASVARRHETLTDYHGFGVEVRYDCQGHPALARRAVETARAAGVRAATASRGVDSGVAVPMHFLAPRRDLRVVPVSIATAPVETHRAWGAALRRALDSWPERVVFVVGGLLSSNWHAWNLTRDVPESREFDERALEALRRGAWGELAGGDRRTTEKAQPEAGLRHLEVLRGFLGADLPGTVHCYEPGPGVGAALVEFALAGAAATREDDVQPR